MNADISSIARDGNCRDINEIPDSEEDPEIKKPRWKTPPDVSEDAIRGKKSTKRCQHSLSPIVVLSDDEDLDNRDALDDDMPLTDYSEKAALESEAGEDSIIDEPESPDQFDGLLPKPRRGQESMSGSSALPRKTITHTDQPRLRSGQKNTRRNPDNVIQCVQTQKERNAHSTLSNKLLNMTDRGTRISTKENVSSAYSGRSPEPRARIPRAQTQTGKQISSVDPNQPRKTTESSQTRKRKAVSPPASHHRSRNWTHESSSDEESDNLSVDSDEDIELPKSRRPVQNEPPKPRTIWTDAETKRLVKLFETHGTQWRLIQEKDRRHPHGAKLIGRTNINLKDRIRTLKLQYQR